MSKHVFGTWYPASDPPEVTEGGEAEILAAERGNRPGEWHIHIVTYFNNCLVSNGGRGFGPHTGFFESWYEGGWDPCFPCFWMPAPPPPDAEWCAACGARVPGLGWGGTCHSCQALENDE